MYLFAKGIEQAEDALKWRKLFIFVFDESQY